MLTSDEITRLKSLSDDALLGELGSVLSKKKGGLQARPPSLKKLIQEANNWLKAERQKLQAAICNDPRIQQIATSEAGATEKLTRVVADVVSSITIFVPAGTVAEILVRDGIPTYCKDIWEVSS